MPEGKRDIIAFPKYSNVRMHSKCRDEIIRLIRPEEVPEFLAAYESRVDYLSKNMGQEISHRTWFEVLKKSQGLRAIRFLKCHNLRILYVIENGKAYLLLAFKERKGHRNTEYSSYIEPALNRLRERNEI